jgi:hypothetical protein
MFGYFKEHLDLSKVDFLKMQIFYFNQPFIQSKSCLLMPSQNTEIDKINVFAKP